MEEPTSPDTPDLRKQRGAFFTPQSIASFLVRHTVGRSTSATVLDPTCGDGVFLVEAARHLRSLGVSEDQLASAVTGVDIHDASLADAVSSLAAEGFEARTVKRDFFLLESPGQLGAEVGPVDAVVGNPPFVRYQNHTGKSRNAAAAAALRQGVRLSGLSSSWAPALVHATSFLKPGGRIGMVLPAELLTVHYAEPIRRWLQTRFSEVNLVVFENLQFSDALENVVLLLAGGSGGCDSFSMYFVDGADDLDRLSLLPDSSVSPAAAGKWTDLLLPEKSRDLFRSVVDAHFGRLDDYGNVGLGTVTGANKYFAISEETRLEYRLDEADLVRISPPGTRHLAGTTFTSANWETLRRDGERVWMLQPRSRELDVGLQRYVDLGESLGIDEAYKCRVRSPWWRPPAAKPPDLFFTYMSHRFPRLVVNSADVSFLNSMHGVWLGDETPKRLAHPLALLTLNSVSLLGAELDGRSYGGGILKMEPKEASGLPVPDRTLLERTWELLRPERSRMKRQLAAGRWTSALARIDEALLVDTLGLSSNEAAVIHDAATSLRERRLNRGSRPVD